MDLVERSSGASGDVAAFSTRKKKLAYLMGRPVRMKLNDGREYEGEFYCVDDKGNIILNNADMLKPLEEGSLVRERVRMAIMLVQGQYVNSIKVKKSDLTNAIEKCSSSSE